MNDHPVYWTATLRCTHETSTQGRPTAGNWLSCDSCHSERLIVSVSPILRTAPGPGEAGIQEPLWSPGEEAA